MSRPIPHIIHDLPSGFDPKGAIPIYLVSEAGGIVTQDDLEESLAPLIARIAALEAAQ